MKRLFSIMVLLVLLSQVFVLSVNAEDPPEPPAEPVSIQADDDIDTADPEEGETQQPDPAPDEQLPASESSASLDEIGGAGPSDDWRDEMIRTYTEDPDASAATSSELELLQSIDLSLKFLIVFIQIAVACLIIWFFIIKPISAFAF